MDSEYAIVGGGVVGLSLAYGLLKRGRGAAVFDEGDDAFRASRGNFGLVWVQGKGLGAPDYARWTRRSAKAWQGFAEELRAASGQDLALSQEGGYDFYFDEVSLARRAAQYEALRAELGGDYPFDVLGHNALKREEPGIGPEVAGAILHHEDGHVNPLLLLKALAGEVRRLGGLVRTRCKIVSVESSGGEFRLISETGATYGAAKVILTAGLGAAELGPALGFKAPVRPQRGQVLITERLPKMMKRPSGIVRQVNEGGIQIGDSKEEVGLDDRETLETTAQIAARAIRVYPALAKANLLRSWGALRIMSPDGLPIYQRSKTLPGAYLATCHSGITLAAAHANFLPDWLDGGERAPNLEAFGEDRFAVP